jgi:hypothetical protein
MAEASSRPSDMETTFPVWDDGKVEEILAREGGASVPHPRARAASVDDARPRRGTGGM